MQKFSKKSSLVLTLCILSAISSSGYAAEKDSLHQYNLDEYVVTATRTGTDTERSSAERRSDYQSRYPECRCYQCQRCSENSNQSAH